MKIRKMDLCFVVVGFLLIGASTSLGAVPRTICDDNFDNYTAGDNYTAVNPWGWHAVSGWLTPTIANSWNVSSPSSLVGPSYLDFAMQLDLTGSDILNAANGACDVTVSLWFKSRNAYWTPVKIIIGELSANADRAFFVAGGDYSWTYKYNDGTNYIDLLDFNGQPLQVPHGDGERFNQIVLKFVWNSVAGNYGSTYQVQIFDNDTTPRCPLTTVSIDAQFDGLLGQIDGFWVGAGGENHPNWIDDLKITAILPSVQGTVVPGNYSGDVKDVGIKIVFRQSGNPVRTERLFLDANGMFTVPNVQPGIYDIVVKSYASLQKVISGVNVASNITLDPITLVNGNVDGDNGVTSTDLSIVLLNMDLMGDN